MALRVDREDLSEQLGALRSARTHYAGALRAVIESCHGDPGLADVAAESRLLVKSLTSAAKRPPRIDASAWAGAVSAAARVAVRSDEWDAAVASARTAETALDLAALDLYAAQGGDV